jgi:putative transposase
MQIGNRFRFYPTPAQAQTLLAWIGCQRFIYNAKVGEDRYFRGFARQSLSHTGEFAPIDQKYSHFKTEQTPWLGGVPSQILRNGAVLWKQAYGRYFSKLAGRPTIHRKTGEQSVWLTSELFTFKPAVDKDTGEINKKCGILKNKVGEVISEPVASVPPTLGETEVSRLGGNIRAHWSLTQETPATATA